MSDSNIHTIAGDPGYCSDCDHLVPEADIQLVPSGRQPDYICPDCGDGVASHLSAPDNTPVRKRE